MKIDILVPVSVNLWDKNVAAYANKVKSSDVEIEVHSLTEGVASIECDYDMALAAPYTVAKAEQLEKAGSQAVIIYCFAEPALAACKEKLGIPVVGIKEASLAMATLMGNRIGVIAPIPATSQTFERGARNKVYKYISLDLPVLEYGDSAKVEKGVDIKTAQLVDAGCDVVVLGCGSMMGLDLQGLMKKHNVPIIFSLSPAIYAVEYMVRSGLRQSKITYPFPPVK